MTPTIRLAATGLMLSALVGLAACQQPAETTEPASAPAVAASPDVYPFQVGSLQLASLKDGELAPQVAAGQIPWDPAGAAEALTAAGQPADVVHLSIQPLLVRDGDRVVLIDSGAGGQMGTQNKLVSSLRAAGVTPEQVTDVLISHAHGDHVGGLVNAQGALTFPNATIRMSNAEWTYAQNGAEAAGAGPLLAAITPKVQAFAPGVQITPSIRAVPLNGHTPGHSGYEIVSGNDRLLYIGDALHSSVISVTRPDLVNAWDDDSAAAIATRRTLRDSGQRLYAVHFPFPGLGRIEHTGETYRWVPAN